MSHDLTQWLAEIKALRQQLAEAQKEREEAHASAANWRRLYETEAQQRRTEANLARQTIEQLRQEAQQLRRDPQEVAESIIVEALAGEVSQLQTLEELRQKLVAALVERDRLIEALKTEQANHAQTRKSLTTALGDAIDMLSKEQNKQKTDLGNLS